MIKNGIAYSLLTLKSVDEDAREITGIASTPEPDRMGDIVVAEGVEYKLPIPLLWQHDPDQPIGEVYEAKQTKKGIEIKARLVKLSQPSQLAARLEEAWQSIKSGLVKGLSIGFRPIEYAFIEDGGIKFLKWEWYELSAVTIPANASASISTIKSFDAEVRKAALGDISDKAAKKPPSGATGKTLTVKLTPKEGKSAMNIAEKLKAFKDELVSKQARIEAILEKSAETGITLDEAETEEYDTLVAEVKELSTHVKRFEDLQASKAASAVAVPGAAGTTEGAAATARAHATVKTVDKPEKGIMFARYAMCMGAAQGNHDKALSLAKAHYPNSEPLIVSLSNQAKGANFAGIMKATVEAGTTLDATFAAPLVQYQNFAGDFVEFLRPRTIIGQFGTGNIPALRKIPFNVRIKGQNGGASAGWVGEGAPKPLTQASFNDVELRWAKIAAISVLTEELIRFSDPSAEALVRDELARAVIERMDIDFIDPAKAAVNNVSPASITNGVTAIQSSGNDAEDIRCDLQKLWAPFIAARNPPRSAVYIMDSTTALALSMMQNPLGQLEFPGITINGGTFNGVPVIVSDYIPSDSSGGMVILVNASDIWLADDGQVTLDASREASLQMLDNPTNNSASGTATSMVSMFQTNSVALRAERYINWAKRRPSGVSVLTDVLWGACA